VAGTKVGVVTTIPPYLQHLVDDAAIFPPGNAPLPEAVAAHREHRASGHAALVGPFVVSDMRLPELLEAVGGAGEALPVSVVVTGGAGAIEPAVRWATRAGTLELRGLEVALRDEADLAHNARRMATAVDRLVSLGELGDEVPVYVEPPRLRGEEPTHSWLSALDELAAVDLRVKLRTGGVEADAFPSAAELATSLAAVLDRELRFKATAGLHNAVRHRDPETGFEHHGFLNVLLATRASLDGGAPGDVARVLEESDGAVLAERLSADPDEAARTRRWFTSFGSCSVLDVHEDLVELDLWKDEA